MKKNTTTALAKCPDPVVAICQSVTPPPTKRDVLIATATALHREQRDARNLALSAKQKKQQEALDKTKAVIYRGIKQLEHGFRVVCYGGQHKPFVEIKVDLDGELAQLVQSAEAMPLPPVESTEEIVKELRDASQDRTHIVNGLLNDPAVKTKLMSLGKKLLGQPTADDKANAIPV